MKQVSSALLILLTLFAACKKPEKKVMPPPVVRTTYPVIKTVPIWIQTTGHIDPIQDVDIQPQVDGQIIGLHYNEGDYVRQGDLLVTIDPRIYVADLHKAEAELIQNQALLAYAKDTASRNEPLVKDDFISQDNFDKLVSNVQMYEGAILENEAQMEAASVKVDYCTIRSPIDGVLGNQQVDMGNIATTNENQTLVTIKQIAPIWTIFGIPERHLTEVFKERQNHPLQVELYTDKPSKPYAVGELVFVDNVINKETGMISMKGLFKNENHLLWPGRYVNVRLITRHQPNTILVPSVAVQQGQDFDFVFTIDKSNKVHKKKVVTGLTQDDGAMIMIEKGLKVDEQVIIDGVVNVYDGVTARILNKGSHE